MLDSEPQIIDAYVDSGQARIVFWPMLDHGNASLNAHAAADCVGRQSADAFWVLHDYFFLNQGDLWRADRDYFVDRAVDVGVDQVAFEECYDSGTGHATVTELDSIRRAEGMLPTIWDSQALAIRKFERLKRYIAMKQRQMADESWRLQNKRNILTVEEADAIAESISAQYSAESLAEAKKAMKEAGIDTSKLDAQTLHGLPENPLELSGPAEE